MQNGSEIRKSQARDPGLPQVLKMLACERRLLQPPPKDILAKLLRVHAILRQEVQTHLIQFPGKDLGDFPQTVAPVMGGPTRPRAEAKTVRNGRLRMLPLNLQGRAPVATKLGPERNITHAFIDCCIRICMCACKDGLILLSTSSQTSGVTSTLEEREWSAKEGSGLVTGLKLKPASCRFFLSPACMQSTNPPNLFIGGKASMFANGEGSAPPQAPRFFLSPARTQLTNPQRLPPPLLPLLLLLLLLLLARLLRRLRPSQLPPPLLDPRAFF